MSVANPIDGPDWQPGNKIGTGSLWDVETVTLPSFGTVLSPIWQVGSAQGVLVDFTFSPGDIYTEVDVRWGTTPATIGDLQEGTYVFNDWPTAIYDVLVPQGPYFQLRFTDGNTTGSSLQVNVSLLAYTAGSVGRVGDRTMLADAVVGTSGVNRVVTPLSQTPGPAALYLDSEAGPASVVISETQPGGGLVVVAGFELPGSTRVADVRQIVVPNNAIQVSYNQSSGGNQNIRCAIVASQSR